MSVQFFDRRGNETDPNGNRIVKSMHSAPGNRSSSESVIYNKKPKAAAAPASPPANPPKPPKNSNKKNPEKDTKYSGGLTKNTK